ncbi:Uncharacterised protein [Serratia fonticola]|uniref:Uncharacterized protein n=1 Tax=Serratia fonticola TaxID=47917 RepID=A0A4U9WFZ2_SERFO|nr:Uncharacterised protein [Serratia fonticola]
MAHSELQLNTSPANYRSVYALLRQPDTAIGIDAGVAHVANHRPAVANLDVASGKLTATFLPPTGQLYVNAIQTGVRHTRHSSTVMIRSNFWVRFAHRFL